MTTSGDRRDRADGAANIWPFNRPFLAASSKTFTNGTVQISGGANITVGTTGNTITISGPAAGAFSGGASNLGNTAGSTGVTGTRMVLVGTNNITLSQSTDASGATISISGQSPAGGAFSGGVSTGGNTAGSTGVTGTRMVLVGTNMVSLSQSTDANGGTVSINATQSVQTQDVLSIGVSTGGNTSGNTTVNTGSRLVFVGSNNITLSQGTAAGATTITVSGANTTPSFSAGVSTAGNTAGSTGVSGTRMVLVGTNNITLSQSTDANGNTISISGAGGGAFSGGVSNLGNTAGSTGVTGTRLVLVGTNNVTLSQSTDANGATISISAAGGGGGAAATISKWPEIPLPIATSSMNSGTSAATAAGSTQTTANFYVAPFEFDDNVTFNQIRGAASYNTAAGTGSISAAHYLGLYSLNGGTALSLISSAIFNVVMSQNSVTAQTASWWWGTNSTSNSSSLNGNVSASFTGLRPFFFSTGANSISPGEYWLAHGYTHRTSGASIGGFGTGAFIAQPGTTTANLQSTFGSNVGVTPYRFIGSFSTTSNATTTNLLVVPASIHTSVITGTGGTSQWLMPNITIMST